MHYLASALEEKNITWDLKRVTNKAYLLFQKNKAYLPTIYARWSTVET